MNKNIEIEYKLLLKKEEYEILKPLFKTQGYEQTNYYFDTKDEKLRKARVTLRVRLKDGQYEFTLKRSGTIGIDEFNENISKNDFECLTHGKEIKSEILTLLKDYQVSVYELCQIYSLKTYRQDLSYKNGLLSLDKSEYLGVTDYEIEYEVTNTKNAINDFNDFLSVANVKYVRNCKGKRHRLCDVLYKTPFKR